MRNKTLLSLFTILAFLSLLAIIPMIVERGFIITLLYNLFIFILLAESWYMIGGLGGQVFLGTAAFFGFGAYIFTLLYLYGIPYLFSIPLAGFATSALGIILLPTFKLRGVYFVVGSIYLGEIMKIIVLMSPFMGGAAGLYLPILSERVLVTYYLAFLLMITSILTSYFLYRSRVGMALRAIRGDEDAAEMFGVNPMKYKFIALLLTALFSGLGGAVHALYMIYLEPHSFFSLVWSLIPCFTSIIGGISSIFGPILGTLIYILMREAFIFLSGEIYLAMLGVLLIVIMRFTPGGIYSLIERATAFKLSRKETR